MLEWAIIRDQFLSSSQIFDTRAEHRSKSRKGLLTGERLIALPFADTSCRDAYLAAELRKAELPCTSGGREAMPYCVMFAIA